MHLVKSNGHRHRLGVAAADPHAGRGVGGTVLVIVLVTILFTSVALFAFMEKASNDLLVEVREADARRLRTEAMSAMETVLAVLEDFRRVNSGLRSPAEGWADPLAFAGYDPGPDTTVQVEFEDESGKLSLPTLDSVALIQLFVSWEMPRTDAEKLTDALLGWMRPDYVPASASSPRPEDYEQGDLPYQPPGRAMRSYSELAAIEVARDFFFDESGTPNANFKRFKDAVSLYQYNKPNLNGAAAGAMAALGQLDPNQQRRLDDFRRGLGSYERDGPGYFKSAAEAASLLGQQASPDGFGVEIQALRIRITVSRGAARYQLSAVVAPPGGAQLVKPGIVTSTRTGKASAGASKAAPTPTPTPRPARSGRDAGASKKLNYPFTLLEITENVVMSISHAPNTELQHAL